MSYKVIKERHESDSKLLPYANLLGAGQKEMQIHQDRAELLKIVEEAKKVLKIIYKDNGWQFVWDMIVKLEDGAELCPLCANPSLIKSSEEGVEIECSTCKYWKEDTSP